METNTLGAIGRFVSAGMLASLTLGVGGCVDDEAGELSLATGSAEVSALSPSSVESVPNDKSTQPRLSSVVATADIIAHVEVTAGDARMTTVGRQAEPAIATTWTLRVIAASKGAQVHDRITVDLPGGHIGERGYVVTGIPRLVVGGQYIAVIDFERSGHAWVGGERALLEVDRGGVFMGGRPVTDIDDKGIALGQPPGRGEREPLVPVGTAKATPVVRAQLPLAPSAVLEALRAVGELQP